MGPPEGPHLLRIFMSARIHRACFTSLHCAIVFIFEPMTPALDSTGYGIATGVLRALFLYRLQFLMSWSWPKPEAQSFSAGIMAAVVTSFFRRMEQWSACSKIL